jgi:hypothetical protein
MYRDHLHFKQENARLFPAYSWIRWSGTLVVFLLASLTYLFSNTFVQNVSADGAPAFIASEDTFVKSSTPTTNFGTAPDLEVQNDTRLMRSLIRFTVSGLPAGAVINSVVLQLYVPSNGSVTGGDISQVNGPWSESTVAWSTTPAIGAKLGSMPNPVKSGAWAQAAVPTSYVTGNGTFDFYLTTSNTTDAVYYASNNTTTPPTLIVAWSLPLPTPTPTPTLALPLATDTPTPTPTLMLPLATDTPTPTPTLGLPTATATPTPTPTLGLATATATPTPTPTPTPTLALPTATATPTPTPTLALPTATATPTPTPTATPTPTPTTTPTLSSVDPVVVAAGDIACDPGSSSFNGGLGTSNNCRMGATANLISGIQPAAVLSLGDIQYYCGSLAAFNASYNLSWGQFKSITHPAVGNHEYLTSGGTGCDVSNTGAAGYFTYFGAQAGLPSQGFYSYDLGSWHIVVLNSNCSQAGGCNSSSPQYKWLAQDLLAHPSQCTLAYWHIPLYSSGGRANANTKSLYQLLYNNNADLILTGHDHTYERFAPQDANGTLDLVRGIREFVVGSGGSNHTSLASLAPNSEIFNQNTYGVLKVSLHSNSYDWQFVPELGKTFTDSGTTLCH